MAKAILETKGLTIAADETPLLHEIDLTIDEGTTHVLMGPNGAGKSTLGSALMGNPEYTATAGSIIFDGQDITELSPDKRSAAGLFMSFQAPVEVPGVPLFTFLRAIVAQRPDLKLRGPKLKKRITEIMAQLDMDPSYLDRELNVGFSGGEKKKVEMLQLLLLQPKLAILDETDSGLDVDALDTVSRAIRIYQEEMNGSLLMITHNTRILEHLDVDQVHVLVRGRLVDAGCASLINEINDHGFERYVGQAGSGAASVAAAQAKAAAAKEEPQFDAALAIENMEAALAEADAKAGE
ncbi:MAG: Fe-S cluster assembly ATPase SufC [Coriobacteriia bacterium]|nr:Fe-S cluster assembly ATPase SufC [Coriobacteriia bacterium]